MSEQQKESILSILEEASRPGMQNKIILRKIEIKYL